MLKISLKKMSELWRRIEALGTSILGWVGFPPVMARQLIRFGITGVSAASVYVSTTALLVEKFGQSILVSTVIAFFIGGAVSYVGNALWSFEARPTLSNAARFTAVQGAGLVINIIVASISENTGIGYLIVTFTVVAAVPVFNFVCHRLITFAVRAASKSG